MQGLGVQVLAQMRVGRVLEEAGAQDGDGLLHPLAQLVQGAGAGGDGFGAPLLQPARGRGLALGHLETGGVQQPVQQYELVEQLTVEDRLQVELDVGGRGQCTGVAQQPQLSSVGHHGPQVVRGAVQRLLHQ